MSDDDLRTLLREVDGELDHGRVLRAVDAHRRPSSRTSHWAPLAAAVAVACVLLASVGTLAWISARDEPALVPPASAPLPDAGLLAARARVAIAGDDVACSRVEQDGQVVLEQLRTRGALLLGSPDERGWPGCGPSRAPTPAATDRPTRAPSYDLKQAATHDLLAPLADRSTPVTAVRGADGAPVLRVETSRLRYDYRLDAAGRPDAVRVRLRGEAGSEVSATITWFGPRTAQAERLVASAG